MIQKTRIAIVGGGITGLALAHELSRAGLPHVVLEASDRPGGVIRSARVEGHLLEWGPQRTRLTTSIRALVERLDLSSRIVTAPIDLPLFVHGSGKLRRVPLSVRAFLGSDIVPLSAKLALLREPLTGAARDDESVADFFTRKLGRSIYENIAGPLYGGLYASDPADMIVGLSLRHVLREFRIGRSLLIPLLRRGGGVNPPPAISFDEGMATLPRALHAVNRSNVVLSTPVHTVTRSGHRWRLEHRGGQLEADRLVLTTPASATARLLRSAAPDAAKAIGGLVYNPLAVVHLHATTDLRGLGYQVSLGERMATRGVTFNDSLFGRRGVYTAYLGGARSPDVVEWSDEEISRVAKREFRQVTGFDARVLNVAREAMPAWDRSWTALAGITLPAGIVLAANWESRPGIPGRLAQAERLAREFVRELA